MRKTKIENSALLLYYKLVQFRIYIGGLFVFVKTNKQTNKQTKFNKQSNKI